MDTTTTPGTLEKRQDTNVVNTLQLNGDFSLTNVFKLLLKISQFLANTFAHVKMFYTERVPNSQQNPNGHLTLFLKLNQEQFLVFFRLCNMSRNIWIL